MDFKELYITEVERLTDEYMEHRGLDWSAAYELASNDAYGSASDRLADYADSLRQRMKDEG